MCSPCMFQCILGVQKDARVLTKLPETITDRIVADVYYPFEHGPRKGPSQLLHVLRLLYFFSFFSEDSSAFQLHPYSKFFRALHFGLSLLPDRFSVHLIDSSDLPLCILSFPQGEAACTPPGPPSTIISQNLCLGSPCPICRSSIITRFRCSFYKVLLDEPLAVPLFPQPSLFSLFFFFFFFFHAINALPQPFLIDTWYIGRSRGLLSLMVDDCLFLIRFRLSLMVCLLLLFLRDQ